MNKKEKNKILAFQAENMLLDNNKDIDEPPCIEKEHDFIDDVPFRSSDRYVTVSVICKYCGYIVNYVYFVEYGDYIYDCNNLDHDYNTTEQNGEEVYIYASIEKMEQLQ